MTETELRHWQEDAKAIVITKVLDRGSDSADALIVASPGAGKTFMSLAAVRSLIDMGEVERVIIVCPQIHLKEQWARGAAELGIDIDPDWAGTAIRPQFRGIAITYQQLSKGGNSAVLRTLGGKKKTLVILDECHHLSEDKAWGDAALEAFSDVVVRLSITGTPFRTDGRRISFFNYDKKGRCAPDKSYTYKDALSDGVVRPICFHARNGVAEWYSGGDIHKVDPEEAPEGEEQNALKTLLNLNGDYLPDVIGRTYKQLLEDRKKLPNAAMILFAFDQEHARGMASIVSEVTGERAVVAVSDDPGSDSEIERFRHSNDPVIIAVRKISEGIDIPRLTAMAYLSTSATPLLLKQSMGRVIRVIPGEGDITANVFFPPTTKTKKICETIQDTVCEALEKREEAEEEARSETGTGSGLGMGPPANAYGFIGSEATGGKVITADNKEYTAQEWEDAKEALKGAGRNASESDISAMADYLRHSPRVEAAKSKEGTTDSRPLFEILKEKRGRLSKLVGLLVALKGRHGEEAAYKEVNRELKRARGGVEMDDVGEKQLDSMIRMVERWMAKYE